MLGLLALVLGTVGTIAATLGIHRERRPKDVGFALIAPILLVTAMVGLLLLLRPEFFS